MSRIYGSARYLCEMIGMASHAGTTPMDRRRDAAVAVAELALYVEHRAMKDADSVGTIGILQVPNGSTNVVPGRCQFTLDLRAPTDAQRDAMVSDVLAELAAICKRRQLHHTLEETMRAAAAPSAPVTMNKAMLFVRGQNAGISHNPLESTTSDDMQLAVDAFSKLLDQLATEF